VIQDIKGMMAKRLLCYKNKNKALPEKVILFRTGVPESQFDLVLRQELPEIKKAFVAVYGVDAAHPKLSIIMCGKRNRTRLISTSAGTASHNGNTRAGTVIDKGVTDVYRYDFYLQASSFGLPERM
jgi:eukaryotic translation initiation factor 2C